MREHGMRLICGSLFGGNMGLKGFFVFFFSFFSVALRVLGPFFLSFSFLLLDYIFLRWGKRDNKNTGKTTLPCILRITWLFFFFFIEIGEGYYPLKGKGNLGLRIFRMEATKHQSPGLHTDDNERGFQPSVFLLLITQTRQQSFFVLFPLILDCMVGSWY